MLVDMAWIPVLAAAPLLVAYAVAGGDKAEAQNT